VTPSLFTSVVGASGVFPVLLDTCALFGPLLRDVLLEAGFEQGLTCDPKDRHVLAAAIVGGCKVIVTQNTNDFPKSSTEPFGIRAVRPGMFLLDLFHLDRPQMVDCLRKIEARNTRYPQTLEEILHCRGLTSQAPVFARECCEYLGLPIPPAHQ
jgi:hypothetical protein